MVETREELESRMRAAKESMNKRLQSMEETVRLPKLLRPSKGDAAALKRVAAATIAGLAVGLIFGGGGKKARRRKQDDSFWEGFAESVREIAEKGGHPVESIKEALSSDSSSSSSSAAIEKDTARKGAVGIILGYALKSAVNAVVKEMVNRRVFRNEAEDGQ